MIPSRHSLTPATLVLFALFGVTSVLVVLNLTMPWDVATLEWMGRVRRPWLTDTMLLFTFVGNGLIEFPFALLVGYLLWRLGRSQCARRFIFAALSAELLYLIIKPAFHRERPRVIERLADAGWYSYPSGHAMLAPVIYGFGLLLLARSVQHRWTRIVLLALSGIIPPSIALSRVYLGVHYPSDVVGALFLGTALVLLWNELGSSPSSSDETSSPAATR